MPVVEATAVEAADDSESRTVIAALPADPPAEAPMRARRARPGAGATPLPAAATPPRHDRRGRPLGAVASLAALVAGLALVAMPAAAPQTPLQPAPALEVQAGFAAQLYAKGLKRPTALAFGPGGLLYATQESGEVVAVGRGSTRPRILARGFRSPLGLAWQGATLYVSRRARCTASSCAASG